jgi:hypothetical protein
VVDVGGERRIEANDRVLRASILSKANFAELLNAKRKNNAVNDGVGRTGAGKRRQRERMER